MSLHTLDCNHWRLSRWQRLSEWVRDRLPPGWPAMVACYLIVFGPIAVYAGACLADWLVTP